MKFQIQAVNWQEHGDLAIEGNIKSGAGRVKVAVEKPDDDTVKELFKFLQPGKLVTVSNHDIDLKNKRRIPQLDEDDLEQSITEDKQAVLNDLKNEDGLSNLSNNRKAGKQEVKISQVVKDFDPSQIGDAVKLKVEDKSENQSLDDHNLNVTKPDVNFESPKFDASDFEKQKAQKKKEEKRVYEDTGNLDIDDSGVSSEVDADEDKPKW